MVDTPPRSPRASSPPSITGRRAAARLRLGVDAQLVTLAGAERCELVDLSLSGARVALAREPGGLLGEGEGALLRVGGLEAFGEIVRCGSHGLAFAFDEPLANEDVLAMRAHAEGISREPDRTLRRQARDWVTGGR